MKLIAVETGRSSLLFPLEEIAPLKSIDSAELIAGIVNRYDFKIFPADDIPREQLDKNGAKFEKGRIKFEGALANILEFTVYNDGMVINSSSTEAASAFIDDLLGYIRSKFGFREFTSKTQRTHVSQVVVEFEKPLAKLVPASEMIIDLVAAETGKIYDSPARMNFARLDFQLETETSNIRYPIPRFFIERRAGTPFSQERYYSSAPMNTRSHLSLLEKIEKTLR